MTPVATTFSGIANYAVRIQPVINSLIKAETLTYVGGFCVCNQVRIVYALPWYTSETFTFSATIAVSSFLTW